MMSRHLAGSWCFRSKFQLSKSLQAAVLVTFNYHLVIVLVALKSKSLTFIQIIALDYF